MKPFKDLPIRAKLMRHFLLLTGTVLLLTAGSFIVIDVFFFRQATLRSVESLTEAIAYNSAGSLAFDSTEDAKGILEALRSDPNVLAAVLRDAEGAYFVGWQPEDERELQALEFLQQPRDYAFKPNVLIVARPVARGDAIWGTLTLYYDLSVLLNRLLVSFGIAIGVLAAALSAAWFLANILQRRVSLPIVAMAGTARQIADKGDYTLRAPVLSQDEIGELAQSFNEMLVRLGEKEEALRDSDERLRVAVESAEMGVWDWNIPTSRLRWHGPLFQELGLTEKEVHTCNPGFLSQVRPDDQKQLDADVQEAIKRGGRFEFEFKLTSSRQQHLSVRSKGKVYLNEAREAVRMTGVLIDVTELAHAQRDLQALNESLERRVEERTAELTTQTARLRHLATELVSAEQRERKHLASLLHDDLQQLLIAASMNLGIAKRRLPENEDSQPIENSIRWIDEATRAARELTSQLRPPALYEEGFVAALHWLASRTLERHHIEVKIEGVEPTASISDAFNALLFDCVRELILNAVKHAGVDEVSVLVQDEKGLLRVTVEDKGKGFDLEATRQGHTHSGFGLFSIRERLLALGGDVSIDSAPEEGTRVQLEVPLTTTTAHQAKSTRIAAQAPLALAPKHSLGTAIRVLLVDDHAVVRQGLAAMIEEDDRMLVVGEASDGVEAIDAVERLQPDVTLIDVNMPRMNGIVATREICRRWPRSIIIGLSVQDDQTTASLMCTAGAKAFLSKSESADRMIATIISLKAPPALV